MFESVDARIILAKESVLDVEKQAETLNLVLEKLDPSIYVDSISTCHLFRGIKYYLWIQGVGYPKTLMFDALDLSKAVEKQLSELILQTDV